MDTNDIQQLENQLTKAVSYDERSLIRTKIRALRKEKNSGLGVATTSLPVPSKLENESTQRPKSAILPNGYGSNASAPVENGHNRKPVSETIPQSRVTTSKSAHFSKDTNSYASPTNKYNGDNPSKRHSYQPTFAVKEKVLVSRTPPVKRKEPNELPETRGRSRTVDSTLGNDTGPEAITIRTLTKEQIQFCLTEYVNRELKPNKKILPTGESLYLVCADPRILCRLVNVSKKNTIDMRCLTEISDTASGAQIKIAVEENMTLAVESARSIGCHITEEDVLKIIHHDQDIIHKVLLKILSARVVDFEGMEEISSSYFTQPSFLFDKLNIKIPSSSNEMDVTQSVPTKLPSNNDKIATRVTKSGKNTLTSSQEDLSQKASGSAVTIRRIYSDLPPDVKERPQVTKAKQSFDIRGLTASFEKPRAEPVTRQSSDSPKKLEPLQSEVRNSPSNLRRYNDTALTKSSDHAPSKKHVPLVEEQKKSPTENKTLQTSKEVHPYSSRSPRKSNTPKSQDNILDTVSVPKQSKFTQPTPSAVPDNKPSEPTPTPEPVPASNQTAPKQPTSSPSKEPTSSPSKEPTSSPSKEPTPSPSKEPTPSPSKEPTSSPSKEPTPSPSKEPASSPSKEPASSPSKEPITKLTMDIPNISSDSPNNSPSDSTNSTPLASIGSTDESDEYLLTLKDTDPSLTYEQRKRIRQLKRMLKQNQTKK